MLVTTLSPPGDREVVDKLKAESIIESWKALEDLASYNGVSLTNKSYTASAAALLCDFFVESGLNTQFQVLDLSDMIASRPEEEGLEVLKRFCDCFSVSDIVTEVNLSDNAMGSKGIMACKSLLTKPTLESIELCNNGLAKESMDELAMFLTEETPIAKNLTKLHFYNNMSGEEGCIGYKKIVLNMSDKIRDIRMSSTRAKKVGSERIVTAFKELGEAFHGVQQLDLADNSFGPEYGAVLAEVLVKCKDLQTLNLGDCVLEDDGVSDICQALISSGCPLQFLNLGGNDMTAKGAKAVGKLIKAKIGTLTTLSVEDNDEATSRGVATIMNAFVNAQNGTLSPLEVLKVGGTLCGTIAGAALVSAAPSLKNLKELHADGNSFSEIVLEDLTQAFGDKMVELEDNNDEDDYDDDMESSDEEEEEEDKDELNELTQQMTQTQI